MNGALEVPVKTMAQTHATTVTFNEFFGNIKGCLLGFQSGSEEVVVFDDIS